MALGCGRKDATNYQTWANDPPPVTLDSSSSKSFDLYRSAALEAEQQGAKYLNRVSFFPGQRKAAADLVEGPLRKVIRGTSGTCVFEFRPHRPFQPLEYHKGWRLLGRVFAWKVEDAIKAKEYGAAVQLAIAGTKFGFDLTGGGPMDANLGFGIADDIRRALAPHINEFEQEQLNSLSAGMTAALTRVASFDQLVKNENQNMLLAVQAVQDAFQKNDWKLFEEKLGSSGKDAAESLHNLSRQDDAEKVAFFQGMASEANQLVTYYASVSNMPAEERKRQKEPEFPRSRGWKTFSQHFFQTLEPVLAIRDATIARTRILGLTAKLLAERKKGFPSNLPKSELNTDPYSGRPFIYHYDAAQFTLYSVGQNLRDDGGEFDETFSNPDLVLEQ
jgi:hypothetical protein